MKEKYLALHLSTATLYSPSLEKNKHIFQMCSDERKSSSANVSSEGESHFIVVLN